MDAVSFWEMAFPVIWHQQSFSGATIRFYIVFEQIEHAVANGTVQVVRHHTVSILHDS